MRGIPFFLPAIMESISSRFRLAFPFSERDVSGLPFAAMASALLGRAEAVQAQWARTGTPQPPSERRPADRLLSGFASEIGLASSVSLVGAGAGLAQPSLVAAGGASFAAWATARLLAATWRRSAERHLAQTGNRLRALQSAQDVVQAFTDATQQDGVRAYPSQEDILRALRRQRHNPKDADVTVSTLLRVSLLAHGPEAFLRAVSESAMPPGQQRAAIESAVRQTHRSAWAAWLYRINPALQDAQEQPDAARTAHFLQQCAPLFSLSHVVAPLAGTGDRVRFLPDNLAEVMVQTAGDVGGHDCLDETLSRLPVVQVLALPREGWLSDARYRRDADPGPADGPENDTPAPKTTCLPECR
jgi:hypothetical protein